jgi:hypothetical protein
MVVNREFLLKRMDEIFDGYDQWDTAHQPALVYGQNIEFFKVSYPIVSFKTDRGMHRKSPHSTKSYCYELPHWGEVHALIKEYNFENATA